LVYELVPGGNLTNHLAKRREEAGGNLPAVEVLGLIRQITEALAFAHERGLVHRDLKPANVLVNGTALKLADFGIGGIVAEYAAAHSQIGRSMIDQLRTEEQVSLLRGSGTPLYMDPDQRRGGAANPKHDLYSLGVVWYQLLVGDVTRQLHGGWEEELSSEFQVPKSHIEVLKQCVGWIKNRLSNASELLKRLQVLDGPNPPHLVVPLGNGLGMRFAWIPPGTFLMGSPPTEEVRRQFHLRQGQERRLPTADHARCQLPAQPVGPVRHARQRLGVVPGLVRPLPLWR
jgi:serine/threonine protein kinase